MRLPCQSALAVLAFVSGFSAFATQPNPVLTPGVLCSPKDPDFTGYRYPEKVPYCGRNISAAEKARVAQTYGIPQAKWSNYEFDHLIPLSAGGSNDIGNLWPQPIAEARQKDVLENQIYHGLLDGTLKQAEGVREIRQWISAH